VRGECVCKINQLPWHYHDRIKHLKSDLEKVTEEDYEGPLKEEKNMIKEGLFKTGTLVVTQERRITRDRESTSNQGTPTDFVKASNEIIKKFVERLTSEITERISEDPIVELMRETFVDFKSASLQKLLDVANSSGRHYGNFTELKEQLTELQKRFVGLDVTIDELARWKMI